MRVAFAGTPEFAATALRALLSAGFTVPLVLTQPDRPAGRGMKLQASPVKQAAQTAGIPVIQPRGLRLDGRWAEDAAAAQQALQAAQVEVMVVAAYGLILPAWVLQQPPHGCLNIHASVLPRWRGAAPIHRAVEAGDDRTGVTIMQMDEGLDTGPMLLWETVPIDARDTTATLHDRLAALGARLIVEALELAACGGLHPRSQPAEGVTYAHKIDKAEAPLDWNLPATVLERRIRAFDPFPGATLRVADEVVKAWGATALMPAVAAAAVGPSDRPMAPGTVLAVGPEGLDVQCGEGVLRLMELQRPSARRQAAHLVAQALRLSVGIRLA